MAWVADLLNSPADPWDVKVHEVVWLNDGDLVLKMGFSVTRYTILGWLSEVMGLRSDTKRNSCCFYSLQIDCCLSTVRSARD